MAPGQRDDFEIPDTPPDDPTQIPPTKPGIDTRLEPVPEHEKNVT